MYSCILHGWNSHDGMCPTCAELSTTTVASTTINPVESPSGANVLVDGLREIASLYNTPVKDVLSPTDMVIKMGEIAQAALAQYNAASPQTPIDTEPEEELWDCVWIDWQFSGYAQWREKMQSKFHITRK